MKGTIADTKGVYGIALAPALGLGFTSNGGTDSVTIFDLKTLEKIERLRRHVKVAGQMEEVEDRHEVGFEEAFELAEVAEAGRRFRGGDPPGDTGLSSTATGRPCPRANAGRAPRGRTLLRASAPGPRRRTPPPIRAPDRASGPRRWCAKSSTTRPTCRADSVGSVQHFAVAACSNDLEAGVLSARRRKRSGL